MARSSKITASAPRPESARAAASAVTSILPSPAGAAGEVTGGAGSDDQAAGGGWAGLASLAQKPLAFEPEPRLGVGRSGPIIELERQRLREVTQEHAKKATAAERNTLAIGSIERLN